MAGEPRTRRRRPPCRPAPGVQRGRRGALPAQARQGRLRDRDPRARHQHAGPHRRAREAREVQRRGARRDHVGGVHPDHRACRTARDRRRGPCGHPVDRRAGSAGRRRAGLAAHLSAELELPAHVQHGREPHRPVRPAEGARDPRVVVRAVPGRPCCGGSRPPGARAGGVAGGLPQRDDLRPRRLHRLRGDPARPERPREAAPQGRERFPRHPREAPERDRLAAPAHAAPCLPSVPRPRAARPVGRAVLAAASHRRRAAAPDRQPHRHRRPDLRPRGRRARRARRTSS